MNETPTPRTDAAIETMKGFYQVLYPSGKHTVFTDANFARQLERELNEAKKELAIVTSDRNGLMAINEKHRNSINQWRKCAEEFAVAVYRCEEAIEKALANFYELKGTK